VTTHRAPEPPGQPVSHPALGLHELPRGVPAVIEAVATNGPLAQRLADLGFLPGTRVAMIRRAPLGDPTVYEIRGTQLCLRRSEAAGIRVRREEGPGTGAGTGTGTGPADPCSPEAELGKPTPGADRPERAAG